MTGELLIFGYQPNRLLNLRRGEAQIIRGNFLKWSCDRKPSKVPEAEFEAAVAKGAITVVNQDGRGVS